MNRPTVDAALEPQLDDLMNEGYDARDDGDTATAITKWRAAWELLPEPKLQWDYYGQTLSRELANASIDVGDLSAGAEWVELLDEAYTPHSDSSRMLVDFVKAKLYYRAGELDLAWAYFDAIYKVKGRKVFEGEAPEYYEFYKGHTSQASVQPASADAGWEARIPEPGAGEAQTALADDVHAEISHRLAEGDNYMDLGAPQAAAEQYVAAIELLPQPYTQWEASLMLYTALCDACLALTQYAEAEQAGRIALQSPNGRGNGYVWLRLGDALREQGRDGEALEAYTSAYMLEGDELFDGEDEALAMLDAAGIRKDD